MTKPITKYNRTTITLHWLTVLAMFLAIFFIEIHGLFPKGSATRDLTKVIHISFGFLILGLALARLIVRHFTTVPAIEPPMPAWMEKASKAVHHLLLLLMIVIPMLGWLYMSARGRVSPFFGFDILASCLRLPGRKTSKEFTNSWVMSLCLLSLHTPAQHCSITMSSRTIRCFE